MVRLVGVVSSREGMGARTVFTSRSFARRRRSRDGRVRPGSVGTSASRTGPLRRGEQESRFGLRAKPISAVGVANEDVPSRPVDRISTSWSPVPLPAPDSLVPVHHRASYRPVGHIGFSTGRRRRGPGVIRARPGPPPTTTDSVPTQNVRLAFYAGRGLDRLFMLISL